jgi:exodeoxyribonuclease V beta subunit
LFERVFETEAADLLGSAGGERRLTNYLQLADLLQRAAAEVSGAAGLVEWLRRRIALADDHDEEEQLRLESDADRVQIATVHASKGLEYDLVFLPFTALGPARHGQLPCVVEWHAGGLRQAWVRTTKDEEAPEGAGDASEREELAERMRVLYVALTRARYGCWLSWDAIGKPACVAALAQLWHGGNRQPTREDTRAALQRLATAARGRVQVECLPAAGAERLEPVAAAALPDARRFRARIDASWWISSFSQLRDGHRSALPDESGVDDEAAPDAAAATAEVRAEEGADAAVADWPRGERFGTAMHEILEHADFAAWEGHAGGAPPAAAREAIHASLRRHLSEAQGREAELQRVATQLVAAALNANLPGGARLAAVAATARRAEMPFHLAMGGADPARLLALLQEHGYQRQRTDFARLPGRLAGLLTGVIDLVYRHEGRWWIVDYKTNYLGARLADYAPGALAAAVRQHDYDLQYVLYTLALHRWLRSRLGGAYDFERDMGGAVYLFLRGLSRDGQHGVHLDRVPRALVEALDALLAPPGGGDA